METPYAAPVIESRRPIVTTDDSNTAPPNEDAVVPSEENASTRILVVDDSMTMRRIICRCLQLLGYTEVLEAVDGEEASRIIDAGGIDLVITDWVMPNMTGLELTRHIRNNASTAPIPILMVTTRGLTEQFVAAMHAGVNSYIVKPFTTSVLHKKIESVMAYA